MKSKAVVFACLLFVSVAVIALAVSEGNQEQPEKVEASKGTPVEESKQRCQYGCCRYYGHRCVKCCGSVAEAQANTVNNNNNAQQEREVEEATPHRWGGHGGGGGHGGWRGGGGHGGHGGRGGGGGGHGGGGQ